MLFLGATRDSAEMQGEGSVESSLANSRAHAPADEGSGLLAHLDVGVVGGADSCGMIQCV